jgi:SpoVK/Ycf46/Vps4 family AAA+-type ATPase
VKSEQVIAAFRHFLSGHRDEAMAVLRQIEAHESRTGHADIANRLSRLLSSCRMQPLMKLEGAPTSLAMMPGTRPLDTVVLSEASRTAVADLLREWRGRDLLAEHGLPLRHTVLLSGPSGNGKTTLAHAIATELGMPLGVVRYEHLLNSHLGETSKEVAKVFGFASSTPCVVLIDEADALVSFRHADNSAASREGNRIVSSVILGLDALADSIVVLATNAADMIDTAILRRCAIHLELPMPGEPERRRMCEILAERWPVLRDCNGWAEGMHSKMSLAAIEDRALDAARRFVLDKAAKG